MFEVICYDYTGKPVDFLVQWDCGITIEVRNIELVTAPIVHFSNKFSEKSLAVKDGVVYKNKTLTFPLPDKMLREPYMITVYIYVHEYDKNRGKTMNIAKLPVMSKPKPEGYVERQLYEGLNVLELKARLDEFNGYSEIIPTLRTNVTSLLNTTSNHGTRISSLESKVGTAQTDISNIKNNITTLQNNDKTHNSQIQSLTTRTTTAEKDISSLKGTTSTLSSTATAHAGRITNLENGLSTAQSDISTAKSNISTLQSEMAVRLKNSGWSAKNLFLATDSNGNIVTRSAITTVDSALSETSTNSVENKVITENINNINNKIEGIESDIANNYCTTATANASYAAKAAEHIHKNQDVLNGISEENINTWNAASTSGTAELFASIYNVIYPIGSIYISASSTNPGELFTGTTWEAWGSGRVPVGVDSSQSEFDAVEKIGGEKEHALTVSEMPSHDHVIPEHTHSIEDHEHTFDATANSKELVGEVRNIPSNGSDVQIDCSGVLSTVETGEYRGYTTESISDESNGFILDASHDHTVSGVTNSVSLTIGAGNSGNTESTGSGSSHNNLQPYITCYMWKRTA